MRDQIIERVKHFHQIIAELKSVSPYYPQILRKEYPHDNPLLESRVAVYYSTKVRIERDGVWYTVHHVESGVPEKNIPVEEYAILRLTESCYKTVFLYRINDYRSTDGVPLQDIDNLQISETERLATFYAGKP